MANTSIPQALQLRQSASYIDTRLPSLANYQSNATDLEYDMNSIRSALQNFLNRDGTSFPGGAWYGDLVAPTVFNTDAGATNAVRGVNTLGDDLWGLQRKRILKRTWMVGSDVTIAAGGNLWVVLPTGKLPSVLIGAVGTPNTTIGTVVADTSGGFNAASLNEVAVANNALEPKNLVFLVDQATGEQVVGVTSGDLIWGLMQSEFSVDGTTITDTTPNRVQISFVRHNVANDNLVAADANDLNGITFDYGYVLRDAFEDCPEESWLGDSFSDSGVGSTTRQVGYDNQGTGIVTTLSSSTLDVGSTFTWKIGDALDAPLLSFVEGSAGDTTQMNIGAEVDTYTNSALDVDFAQGIQVDNAGGTNTINLGVTAANQIDFTLNGTVTAASGQTVTVTADAAAATLSTTGASGTVALTSVADVDIDADTAITINTANAADASAHDFTVVTGNSTGGDAAGSAISMTAGNGFGTGTGGAVSATAGNGTGTGAGGEVLFTAGAGDGGNGGNAQMTAGAGLAASGADAGFVRLTGGAGDGGGTGGGVFLIGGAPGVSGPGANVSFTASASGATSPANGGDLIGDAGDGGGAGGTGGIVRFTAGDASFATAIGGAASLTGGIGNTSGAGGAASVAGGVGGAAGPGGLAAFAGGAGGAAGDGGAVAIDGGAVANGTAGSVTIRGGIATLGNPGDMTIESGSSGDGNSGILTLRVPDALFTDTVADKIDILGGAGEGAGSGSTVSIISGAGGGDAFGTGGDMFITSGASTGVAAGAGGVFISTGANSGGSAGGVMTLSTAGQTDAGDVALMTLQGGTTAGTGDAGDISILAGAYQGANAASRGGSVSIAAGSGAAGVGGSVAITSSGGAAGIGEVFLGTAVLGGGTETDELITLRNQGSGTGGGALVSFYTEDLATGSGVAPTHSAHSGSMYWQQSAGAAVLYMNVSTGETGSTWAQVQTGADANTLDEVVTNQAGTAFVSGTFTTSWGIEDGQAVNFTDDGGTILLGISSATDGIVSTVETFDVNASGLISMDSTGGAISLDAATAIGIATGTGDIANSTATSAVVGTGDWTLITGAVTAGAFNAGDMNVVLGTAVSGQGGEFTLLGGDVTTGTGGGFTVQTGAASATTGTAGAISLTAGNGFDVGGAITANAGTGLTTGTGGALTANAGNGGSVSGSGGAFSVGAGNAVGTGTGGTALFGSGDGGTVGTGGALTVKGGNGGSVSGPAGRLDITGGDSVGAFNAGNIVVTGGQTTAGVGGHVSLFGGDATTGNGGQIRITSGAGVAGNGVVALRSASDANVTALDPVVEIWNQGTTGFGGAQIQLFTEDGLVAAAAPTVSADSASLYFQHRATTTPRLFMNTSTGSSGTAWTEIETGISSLQTAYVAGETITVDSTEGTFAVIGTVDDTTPVMSLTAGAHTTGTVGDLLTLATVANSEGDALFVNNVGTGAAFTVQDGGADVFDVAATGAITATPTSGTNFTVDTAGAGIISLDAASSSNFTVDGSIAGTLTNSFLATNSDGTAASTAQLELVANQNSAAATAVVSTVNLQAVNDGTAAAASSTVNIQATSSGGGANATTADINIRSTGVSSGVVNTVNVQDTATGSVNVATGAFANDVTLGDTTGTSSFAFNAGSGNITGVASSAVVGSVATSITTTNTDNTAASSADVVLQADASGGSAAVVSNITVDAVVGNATGTATGNFMNDGTNAGITVANIASGNAAASNTVNIASPSTGGTSTVNIASTGTGPADVNIGNTGSTATINHTSGSNTMDFTSTGMAASSDWVLTFPTKNVYGTPNLDADGATNAGVIVNEATYTSFENGSLNGSLVIGRNTGYTAAAGVATYEVTVVSCNATTDTITAFTNNGAATDPTATLTTGGTQAAGNFVLVTGSISRENDGIYQVVTDAANVLTLEAVPGADAGFVKNQVSTTVGDSATVCNVTLSVMRVSAAGEWQIFENANTVASIVYQDFGSTATTLSGSVANVGSSPATMSADFDWRISDNQSLSFSTAAASNETLLSLAPAIGADAVTIGNVVTGTAVNIDSAATSSWTVVGANLTLETGNTGIAGSLALYAGDSSTAATVGGSVEIEAGAGTGALDGEINIGAVTAGIMRLGIDASGTEVASTWSGGAVGSTSLKSQASVSITSGSALGATGADISITASSTTAASGNDVSVTAGASSFVTGDGGALDLDTGAASGVTGGGTGGAFTLDTGGGAQGTAQAGPIIAGAGGSVTAALGAGGAATADGTVAQGSAAGDGGGWGVTGGVGGQGESGLGFGAAGNGGEVAFTGGIGGLGSGESVAGDAADGGIGAKVSFIGGKGGNGAVGTVVAADAGKGGNAVIQAGAAGDGFGTGNNASGSDIVLIPSLAGTGGSGIAATTDGFVHINSASDSDRTILRLDSGGADASIADMFVGSAVPTTGDAAKAGSVFLYNDNTTEFTGGGAFIQLDANGASGTGDNWERVVTSPVTDVRQFVQGVINRTITGDAVEVNSVAGTDIREADFTPAITLPVRDASLTFDTQAEIYFNGVLMFNGTGNDVVAAALGDTTKDIWLLAGAALTSGDIVTVKYFNL